MLQMRMNEYVLTFCYFSNLMVMERAFRFYPPNNVSVRCEFYMCRKGAAAKRSKAGNTLTNLGAPEI